jgi:hypothetical protein
MRLKKSTLDCRVKRTLDAITVVDFVPHGVDLSCKKSTFRKAKANEKSEKTNSFAVGAGLRLRLLKSTCATGVGLGATVSVDLCHRSGIEYLSHGFQTQGTIVARVGLKVRPESTCVPGPWISDPRYDCHHSGFEGCDRSQLVYLGHGFQTQGTECEDHVQLGTIVARTRGPLTARFHRSLHT